MTFAEIKAGIVERLRQSVFVSMATADEAADEIERLRGARDHYGRVSLEQAKEIKRLRSLFEQEKARAEEALAVEVELRAALKRIVDEADSDDGLTAWDGSDIARAALGQKEKPAPV